MRTPGILLLLLTVFATVAYPQIDAKLSASTDDAVANAHAANGRYWRYSSEAPFHDFLGKDVQQFTSKDPQETAARVCMELGGELGHIAAVSQEMQVAFLCRFSEPDLTMSVDFGELDRIPAP